MRRIQKEEREERRRDRKMRDRDRQKEKEELRLDMCLKSYLTRRCRKHYFVFADSRSLSFVCLTMVLMVCLFI